MDEQITGRIQNVLSSVSTSRNGDFPDSHGPNEIPDWDSMNHLSLILALNEEFDIDLDFEEVMAIEKIGDIKDTLNKKGIK